MTPARPEDTADLRDQLAAAARRAESLRAVIASISGELELQPLLTRIVMSAAELLDAPFGSIGLVVETPDGPASGPAASHNLSLLNGNMLLPAGVGLTGKVLLDQAPVRLDRYDALERPVRDDIADHAVIAVPIWWAGSIAGIFSLAAPPPRRFSDDDVAMLEQFADHAAIAITNARLFEAERRRAERTATLTEIGRILTSNLSLDALLRTAVETLAAHLHRHTVAIMLVDSDDPETLVLRSRGGVYAVSNLDGYRQSIHVGIAGAAALARRTILVNDVRTDPRYIPVSAGSALRAELAIPLLVGQRLLGLLNIESEQPFSDEDAESFAIVAGQLAVAIENA
jgi:GAF domain-containing protein